ncbi:MAG TPA: pseudouridine synthase [Candidatus Krumholzibacteriaceae bacterium]
MKHRKHRLILFNKPFRVLCQFSGARPGRATLADFIDVPGVYPAGRLDYDSEGLLLLTDWGPLQHLITDPRRKTPKTYLVQVEGEPERAALERLRRGVRLQDGMTGPAQARLIEPPVVWPREPSVRFRKNIPTAWIELTITEGRNRQVRRMTAAVGHPALRLIRVRVGEWELGSLVPGEWRQIWIPDAGERK